ncbi:Hypothetical protein I595_1054 [Croceitalea dokdonensis DOKDO 023]|uniref:Uncharacterized protein n=1 Tax=Croceitalea dokdonensis DOKDO 023 TaxID=1300341 RepID=A0A0N8H480_9FLAO|nr:Hypothetical protein I595_1054 [Croceitalea dokdonensis DOKDO 023]
MCKEPIGSCGDFEERKTVLITDINAKDFSANPPSGRQAQIVLIISL